MSRTDEGSTPRDHLRVAIAAPLSAPLVERLRMSDPRIEIDHRADLLPPMRHIADFGGEPGFTRSVAGEGEFRTMLSEADALFGIPDQNPQLLREVVQTNPRLTWVHTTAAGGGGQVRAAGLDALALKRVRFTSSAGVHAEALSEFAILGLLAGAKKLHRLQSDQAARHWPDRWLMGQLSEQTVMILGLGGIGVAIADRLGAFGARRLGVNRSGAHSDRVERLISLDAAVDELSGVDAVVSTLPGTAATESLMNDAFLGALRPGATVVSVGRGSVIDESALVRALDKGQVGFAALDVFETEPLSVTSPLWARPNVLISPHTAALAVQEERRIADLFARNARHLLDDRPLVNAIDTVEFY